MNKYFYVAFVFLALFSCAKENKSAVTDDAPSKKDPNTKISSNSDGTFKVFCENGLIEDSVPKQKIVDRKTCRKERTFYDYCVEAKAGPVFHTVDLLFKEVGESSCLRAEEKLLQKAKIVMQDKEISDLRPFEGLVNLELLDLENNSVVDLSSLASLPKLKTLYISKNKISSLAPLSAHKNLQLITVYQNPLVINPVDCPREASNMAIVNACSLLAEESESENND